MPQVKHVVLMRFREDVPTAQIEALMDDLAALRETIPGLLDFSGGAYDSPEGLNKGFGYGFVVTFADAASRDGYLDHPDHERVKQKVLPLLDGGLEGVVAFDYLV